ncbi:TetR/AcrR family transcriptional regulator [Nocardia vinacea]|uniref:TetR/AcrR family transcriptional regulator n=1 Tax=Nocardia vinacea TaxID=96468 RepID=UPI000318FDEA|nr:TetR/AcrR family transcriptional regulator [Nocardia vinacea]
MRRVGAEDSATRLAILDATARIMLEQGHAAATSRRVAALAGVKPALVHYYFPTMDDLFLAVFRRGAEANLERQRRAVFSEQPLHALWQLSREPYGTRLQQEFMALANQRPAIRTEIAAYIERFRDIQVTALTFIARANGLDLTQLPPVVISLLIASVSGVIATENAVGVTLGHADLVAFVEQYLDRFEATARTATTIEAADS